MTTREGENFNFKNDTQQECRKAICWTDRTCKAINKKWNLKDSENTKHTSLNKMRLYINLRIILNKHIHQAIKNSDTHLQQ
jgi:hypothetical protein